tara:strand:+ start:210 stop:464 length:255 start_codon:yes stop_codon:yes gene_type:complete
MIPIQTKRDGLSPRIKKADNAPKIACVFETAFVLATPIRSIDKKRNNNERAGDDNPAKIKNHIFAVNAKCEKSTNRSESAKRRN